MLHIWGYVLKAQQLSHICVAINLSPSSAVGMSLKVDQNMYDKVLLLNRGSCCWLLRAACYTTREESGLAHAYTVALYLFMYPFPCKLQNEIQTWNGF